MTNPREQISELESNLFFFKEDLLSREDCLTNLYGKSTELRTDGEKDKGIKVEINTQEGCEFEIPFTVDDAILALPCYRERSNSVGVQFFFPLTEVQLFVPVNSITPKPVEGDTGGLQDHTFELKNTSGERVGKITYFTMPEPKHPYVRDALDGETRIGIK